MNKQALLQETYDSAFNDELEKISAAQCPGSKIRSKGKGQGKGYGKTKGPIGVPIGKKGEMKKTAAICNPRKGGSISSTISKKLMESSSALGLSKEHKKMLFG